MDFRIQKPTEKNLNTLLIQVSEDNQQRWPKDAWYGAFKDCPYMINPRSDTLIIEDTL